MARSKTGKYLSQRKYALEIIQDTGLTNSKPATFPMEQNHKLALSESPLLEHLEMYRSLVGRLIYLGVTRPDLAYSGSYPSSVYANSTHRSLAGCSKGCSIFERHTGPRTLTASG